MKWSHVSPRSPEPDSAHGVGLHVDGVAQTVGEHADRQGAAARRRDDEGGAGRVSARGPDGDERRLVSTMRSPLTLRRLTSTGGEIKSPVRKRWNHVWGGQHVLSAGHDWGDAQQ